ncbi:MAG: glycosyltransferase family 4 protein [Verrucomicrobiae bacterium]|nr:glycosyltransferase family 4 protein [Verrucomicrobiae bacterium]NNJ43703.1 glycosyltransferase family 4 protein [Akkermansiaceae bacterium]
MSSHLSATELILGNSNPRFSGVTSTMLQVLRYQKDLMKVAVLGNHHLPEDIQTATFRQLIRLCQKPLPDGRCRVFHARRNNEVIQALLLKKLFRAKIRIAFTSTAQRQHSWITRYLIRQSDAIISTCSAAASYIQGGPDIIIPHGIDLSTYAPADDRTELWKAFGFPGKYGIGIFGRVRHQKGVDLLIHAAIPLLKKHPDFTVVICGETTPDQQHFQDRLQGEIDAAGLTDRFIFLGKQPFSALPKLFKAMTLVTALSRNEGFGLTIPEAMASGVAVLASEAGAWKDIVREDVDGQIVPCDDLEATQQQLDLMMADPDQLVEMGRHGRERVEQHYTLEREAKALCDFLSSLAVVE